MIKHFLATQGIDYKIERRGEVIATLTGLPNHRKNTHKAYVGFLPSSDVEEGDVLIDPVGKRLLVNETEVDFFNKEPMQLVAYYFTEREAAARTTELAQGPVFNIGDVHAPAIIGTQHDFSISYGASIDKLLALIDTKPDGDREELEEMAREMKNATEIKEGKLEKFGKVLEKHKDVAVLMGQILLAFATKSNS